ncbi:P22AR C-terminal domain-containing protein [Haemophilus influenzae]|uniref:P22AR C-terminal domain-containing protein n=1 Tax=Haemophilus influenzae TaxID=727 RepID=UPI0010A3358A|nr:P22AR C-terminal domain-containing protein [Haemophilus influenzae]
MTTTLTFQTTTLSVINQNNQIWLTVTEIGKALGYSDPFKSVKNIYDRHRDEFTEKMTALINMPTAGGLQKVRIFSLRGAHLIGMFSHTKTAKDFRKWVLDVLEQVAQPQQLALPEPEKKYTREFIEHDLQQLVWAWFALLRGMELCQVLHPALKQIGSHYAASVYSMAYEYRSTLRHAHNVLTRITEQFECEQGNNWRVLKYLRAYDPKATGFQLDIL